MVFENLCFLVLWIRLTAALEGILTLTAMTSCLQTYVGLNGRGAVVFILEMINGEVNLTSVLC